MTGLLKRLALIALLLALLVVGIGLLLPATWRIERSIVVAADPRTVAPLILDLREWQRWTPWNRSVDESLVVTYGETTSGLGAWQRWQAEHLGSGELRLTSSDPEKGITYRLSMNGGQMQSEGGISIEPVQGGTKVTWHDGGDAGMDLLKRYVAFFFLDRYVGEDFEKGLASLKQAVEQPAGAAEAAS